MRKVVHGQALYQQVADYIKENIVQGVYQRDERIPSESELIRLLGVGRVTVRGGLKILSEEGIIETIKGKGSFVRVDFSEIQNNQEIRRYQTRFMEATKLRILLEPAIAKEVALYAGSEAKEELGRVLYQEREATEKFHLTLMNMLGNSLLNELAQQIALWEADPSGIPVHSPSSRESFPEEVFAEHEQIYQAILRGDGDAAASSMRKHLEHIEELYQDYFRFF